MSKPPRRSTARSAGRPSGRTGPGNAEPLTERVPGARVGRRERPRTGFARRSFFERYRTLILTAIGVVAVVAVGGFVLVGATAKTYACSTEWSPDPTPSPAASATPVLGYVQPDQGRGHVTGVVRFTNCPPASGNHFNTAGQGPIPPRLYGPDDATVPQGWLHNLEHGALVLLYRCEGDACQDSGQKELRSFFDSFPASPVCNIPRGRIGPVIARFDEMKTPYAAIVWDRVLPLDTLDTAQILAFWQQWGEKTNPEQQCTPASASPGPSDSASPSAGTSPSASPGASAAPSSSAAPSGSAATSASPEPSPSPS